MFTFHLNQGAGLAFHVAHTKGQKANKGVEKGKKKKRHLHDPLVPFGWHDNSTHFHKYISFYAHSITANRAPASILAILGEAVKTRFLLHAAAKVDPF